MEGCMFQAGHWFLVNQGSVRWHAGMFGSYSERERKGMEEQHSQYTVGAGVLKRKPRRSFKAMVGALNSYGASFKTWFFEVQVNAMRGCRKSGDRFRATRVDHLFVGKNSRLRSANRYEKPGDRKSVV